jgi:hypothetical protein
MFTVTPEASRQVAKYFDDKKVLPIRIFYNGGG